MELPSVVTRRLPRDPRPTETQMPDAADRTLWIDLLDIMEAGVCTEPTLPEVPSEPSLVKRPHLIKPEGTQGQPFQPDASKNKRTTGSGTDLPSQHDGHQC